MLPSSAVMCRVLGEHSTSAAGGQSGGTASVASCGSMGGQHPWVLTRVVCLAMCAQCKCVHEWKCVHVCNCMHMCKHVGAEGVCPSVCKVCTDMRAPWVTCSVWV